MLMNGSVFPASAEDGYARLKIPSNDLFKSCTPDSLFAKAIV